MTDSEILGAAIALVELSFDGDQIERTKLLADSNLLPDLAMAILERELLCEFGRLALQALLKRDLAMLQAQRAIKLSSINRGGLH